MYPIIFYFVITFFYLLTHTTPLPHHFPSFTTDDLHVAPQQPSQLPTRPREFFQVTHPIPHPPTTPCTSLILNHDFAYSYGREPVLALYNPPGPAQCPHTKFSSIILEWSATCQGRQFDRIFGVWLNGVELLRSCTAEPTRDGIYWKVQKDITRYVSLLMTRNQTLEIYLGNIIDKTYTGIYHVNVTIYYYPHGQDIDDNNNITPVKNPSVDYNIRKTLSTNPSVDYNIKKTLSNNPFVDYNIKKTLSTNYDQNIHYNNNIALVKSWPVNSDQNIDYNNNVTPIESDQNIDYNNDITPVDKISSWADKILPISRNLPLKDGLWFEIENSTDTETMDISIPRNVYRAVLEVYISYHENDEFWVANLPNEYIIANNLTNSQANGPFREVLVSLDGELIGSICPFTVVFTGGINPLLWRPITAIGSFDLPTYDIEVTPFLGKLLDGKTHRFGFSVTNALNVWYVDANLHLWLDKKMSVTKANLIKHNVAPVKLSTRVKIKGLDGRFFTGVSRSIASSGWVESSHGNITTVTTQSFVFENSMVLAKDGNMQIVNQTIDYNTSVAMNLGNESPMYVVSSHKVFPLFLYTDEFDLGNSSYMCQSNVTLGFNEDKIRATESGILSSSLRNYQKGEGNMVVKNNLVVSGVGSMQQIYKYDESDAGICYFRNVSSYNYTILHDRERISCLSDALIWPHKGVEI